ncbi:hypothetical protein L208DRAFT_1265123, partial [Tricholoma matsutake]
MHANIVSEDNECPACSKYFQTIQGRNAHLSTARHCKWWKKGKLSEFGLSTHDTEMLEIVDGHPTVGSDEAHFQSQVVEKLGLSFSNIRGLHQMVDAILDHAGTWRSRTLSFKDTPEDQFIVCYRDVVEAVWSLWGDSSFSKELVTVPQKIFSDQGKKNCIFSEMWTCQWWHAIQSLLPPGTTLSPIIIATNKTELTQFMGGKSTYPVYLTIGNLLKSICRKPSCHACILIGYLPVDKINCSSLTQNELHAHRQHLFHESMKMILSPLIKAGLEGVDMTTGDGRVYCIHPVLAAYAVDYPEQCLVACTKYGTCPKCKATANDLQHMCPTELRTKKWTLEVIDDSMASSQTSSQFYSNCMAMDVSGSLNTPFWKDLPYMDIHHSITPDVLHQLYQGVLKHLINWCQHAM